MNHLELFGKWMYLSRCTLNKSVCESMYINGGTSSCNKVLLFSAVDEKQFVSIPEMLTLLCKYYRKMQLWVICYKNHRVSRCQIGNRTLL